MSILEKLPQAVEAKVQGKPLFAAMADVDEKGQYGERWLIVTEADVTVCKTDGERLTKLGIDEISECRIVSAIGGGTVTADTNKGPVALVRYTSGHAGKFGFAAKMIKALTSKEELPAASVKDLPRRCTQCGTPLLEGTKVCSVCTDKGKVAARLLKYAKPYAVQMTAAAVMMILATFMELVPPYLTKVIVDDVYQVKSIGLALLWFVLGLAGARLMLSLMQTLRGYVGVWVGGKLMGDIRKTARIFCTTSSWFASP